MVFRRAKYKLPKFPPDVAPTFKKLCESLSDEAAASLKEEVAKALQGLEQQRAENQFLDFGKAEALAEVCNMLLDHYSEFSAAEKALVIGAVRYFAISEDPLPEEHFATGFDDDIQVMNHVLEQLGIDGKFIDLD